MNYLQANQGRDITTPKNAIKYLTEAQINALTGEFQGFYDNADNNRISKGRYWLTFLAIRFTGARLGEVLNIDDSRDIDYRNSEIKLLNEKRRNRKEYRQVPVPSNVIAEISRYLMEYPTMKGKVFKLAQGNFRRTFYQIAEKAGIPKDLGHPHTLRHSRAIETLRGGVNVSAVQQILGHSSLTTTAVYLRLSGAEIKQELREKGFI